MGFAGLTQHRVLRRDASLNIAFWGLRMQKCKKTKEFDAEAYLKSRAYREDSDGAILSSRVAL